MEEILGLGLTIWAIIEAFRYLGEQNDNSQGESFIDSIITPAPAFRDTFASKFTVDFSTPVANGAVIDVQKISLPSIGTAVFGANNTVTSDLDTLYQKHGQLKGVDWQLLKAIAQQESSENPGAIGPTGDYGLMQVLCRPNAEGYCTTSFPALPDWPPAGGYKDLLNPDVSLHYGAQIIRWNIDYANGDIKEALAIYNGGIKNPNYSYANKVLGKYNAIKAGNRYV